jgi:deazaflavin-dependent oxidoreductase (nitroreductase family)
MTTYTEASALRRLVRQAAATRPMAWLGRHALHRIDRLVFRISRGRTTFSSAVSGLPVVMLTTTGARTGRQRMVPVLGIADGDRLVVIATNFGQRQSPAWCHNLRAHPRATVIVAGVTREVQARELAGDERDRYFQRGLEINPGWAHYRRRAGNREIPVISLDPVS